MFKRHLSLAAAVLLFAVAVNLAPIAAGAEELQEEKLLEPVYYMDFSPDGYGIFYDAPVGTNGRAEIARQANPADIIFLPGSNSNVDDQIIMTTAGGNASRIYASQATKELYVAFSKGTAAGDMNAGAGGTAEDYCLKSVDTSNASSYIAWTRINFPETYGGEGDSRSKKYRFEMDWKWQAYSNLTTQTSAGSITGGAIVSFIIGGKSVQLNCSTANDTDVRGGGAFRFYESDTSSQTAFGFTGSSQRTTDAALLDTVTKTAAALPATESGKWQHITIDFDFSAGTIKAVIEGEQEKRELATTIIKGADIFAQGISGVEVRGSTKTERRINYADNIKLSPVVPMTDMDRLEAASKPPYTFDDIKGSNTDAADVTEDLSLPSARGEASVTWSVEPAAASQYINLTTGQVTRPTHKQGNQTITLTPTYALNGETLAGDPIGGIVLTAEEDKLAAANNPPYTFDDIKGRNTDTANVTEDLNLPSQKGEVSVTWGVEPSSASQYINLTTGQVTRPSFQQGNQTVTLTPTYELEGETLAGDPISGIVLIAEAETLAEKLAAANNPPYTFDDIKGSNSDAANVTQDLSLPSRKGGVSVTWSVEPAAAAQYINLTTGQVTRPSPKQGNQTVTLTPTYELEGETLTGDSIGGIVLVAEEDKLAAANKTPYTFDDIKGNNTDAANVTGNLSLPSQKGEVNVIWGIEPAAAAQYINLATGQVTRPNFKQGDQTITLTPTYELNGETLQGDSIGGIVLKATAPGDFPLAPVYFMDFNPDTDGEFYDFPQGVHGRTQVTRIEIPETAAIFQGHTAVDNKSIALDSEDNVSKIMPNTRTLNEYAVFSKGSAVGDVNTGAGGTVDDYCLKIIDAGTSTPPNVKITFPEAYGKPDNDNDFVKYRFEMDYKWQQFSTLEKTTGIVPTGTTWIRFHFGESYMSLYSKSGAESSGNNADANGGGALCFTSPAFNMGATTNQRIPPGETGTVTAPIVTSAASGKWVHITVDFDFEEGTIEAVIKGEGDNTRTIKTAIPEGTGKGGATYRSLFMEGLTGVSIFGNTGGNLRAIWADNIKISPMETIKKTPSEKLHDANNPPTAFADIKGGNTDENQVTENLNLISKKGDAAVTWAVSPDSASRLINVHSGLVTRPSYSEGNQSVRLTPTYTVAGRTLVGEPIDIVIAALPESAQEKIERIITNSPFVFDDIKGANTASAAVSTDLTLPKTVEGDIAVSWSILPTEMAEIVDTSTGKVTRPKYTDEDKTVKLVPIYKLEEIEQEGQAIEITVLKNTLDASGYDIQDAYAIAITDLVPVGQSPENVTGNLILPKTGKLHGSSISWSATPRIVDTGSGAVKRPFGASKMDVVLTAAVTNGDSTTVREFKVTIVDSNYGSGSTSIRGSGGGGGGGSVAYTGNPVLTENPDNSTAPGDVVTPPDSTVFHDIDSVEWAKDYIIKLHHLGVVNGDGDGMFSPDRYVTREEFVKMLLLAFRVETDEEPQDVFEDVDAGSWFAPYVSTAYRLKLVNGISGTEFGTGSSITRQDMAAMMIRCLEYKGITLEISEDNAHFEDEDEISGYAREAVENLREAGVLTGDDNRYFNPALFAKRAEVAKVLGMLIEAGGEN